MQVLMAFRSVLSRYRGRGQVGSKRNQGHQGKAREFEINIVSEAWKLSHEKVRSCSCYGEGDFKGTESARQGRENS